MNPEGKSADQIIRTKRFDHSSWHFLQAKSWLDLTKREQLPGTLHYAAIEFRYGIEYLLFELLVLTSVHPIIEKFEGPFSTPMTAEDLFNDDLLQIFR